MAVEKNKETLTLGSLFSGSGGFELAGLLSGITPVWASEIEPFPIRVTTKRLPFVRHYGDVSMMDGGNIEPVDIITFGSPCTDLSIAGKRDGIHAARSGLFFEAIRIIKEMRCKTNGKYPRYAVWENVPGAFSSNKGEDFRCVLESICKICDETVSVPSADKWLPAGEIVGDSFSVAWRVLDAQFWGTPQRRKRIYLVADLTGRCAGKILFESEGLSGYSAEGFRAWQRAAADTKTGSGATGGAHERIVLCDQGGSRMDVMNDKTAVLRAESNHPPIVIENHPADSRVKISEDGVVQTLSGRCGTGGNNVPLLLKIRGGCEGGGKGILLQSNRSATLSCNNDQTLFEPKVYGVCSKASNAMKSDNPYSGFYKAETTRTLDANGGRPDCSQGGMVVVCVDQGGGKSSVNVSDELAPTLAATHGGEPVIAFAQNQRDEVRDLEGKAGALAAEPGIHQQTFVLQGSMIGRADENGPQGSGINEDVCFTIDTADRHAVAYDTKNEIHPAWSASHGTFLTNFSEDVTGALIATDYKDPPVISADDGVHYIVRRLTPTECARLQGFPDWWCADLGTEEPTEEDIAFWREVFETHRRIVTHASKAKTEKQILKWLKDPASDQAEYRMWGNGLFLGNAYFVLSGIVWADRSTPIILPLRENE